MMTSIPEAALFAYAPLMVLFVLLSIMITRQEKSEASSVFIAITVSLAGIVMLISSIALLGISMAHTLAG